jgi:hypothetical protein
MTDGGQRRVGQRRRAAASALAAVALAGIALTACAGQSHVEVGAPAETAPPATDGTAAPSAPEVAPQVGDCRGAMDTETIDAASDPRAAVPCDGEHGAETFWVGEMDPAIRAWPGSDDRTGQLLQRQVDEECSARHLEYLGFDAAAMPNVAPDRLQNFAYFVPTEQDFAEGARWFRCDALVEPLNATESTTIDGTLKDVYGGKLPVSYRLCEARLGRIAACDEDHELEYLASVVLGDTQEYPAQRGDLKVTAACRTPLLTALGLSEERADLLFGYLLPTEADWQSGTHAATCVVGAKDRSTLKGTLADIGPKAPLPTG